ncbi:hypothetical protein [Streptomyces triculaminicus]|uniref:hypothetical protein n=1 Tax=Streptomyces triculaminicus TaxID=2816232 RepID=UPI003794B10E
MAPFSRTLFDRDTTTVRIPRQPRGRRQTPVVIVVPEQLTWGQRAAAAIGRAAWRNRRSFLPTSLALAAGLAVTVARWVAPWSWCVPALIAVAAPLWWGWIVRHRPSDDRRLRRWRGTAAGFVLATGVWAAASVAFGPAAGPLPLLWLLLILAAHIARRCLRPAPRVPESIVKESA